MTTRVSVVADGFNIYHSVKRAIQVTTQANAATQRHSTTAIPASTSLRWLDLAGLCRSYLSSVGNGATIDQLYYFSAFARHRPPGTVQRHMDYVSALTLTGVSVQLASFKRKDVTCPLCAKPFFRYEEKETDVAIAAKVIELAATKQCEAIFLITGDTDVLPAIRAARRLCPPIHIIVGFPYARANQTLREAADRHFEFTLKQYRRWQLPNPITLPNGDLLHRPATW
jgi:uncharacterized LabA/DUF88 family protein